MALHAKHRGKLEVASKVPLKTRDDLSLAYTPGVAAPCEAIAKNPDLAYKYTLKGRTVAVVTDGSAVLGLGNIGGLAGLPVMEGKCLLFKQFAGIDAFPICLSTQDPDEIIKTVKAIAPSLAELIWRTLRHPTVSILKKNSKKKFPFPFFMMISTARR